MCRTLLFLMAVALLMPITSARPQGPQGQEQKPLDIYYIDTEGGKAVLFVSPTGETLLYDTGTGGDSNRDLDRILAVIKAANLLVQQLDHVIVSHYHGDHAGNAAALADKLPIRNYYDHGGWTVELQTNRAAAFNAYRPIREKAHVTTPKPGARIPITGFDVTVVANAGELITSPLSGMPGAGTPNALCRQFAPKVQDPTPENYYAMGMVIRYGNFRMLDLSDLTWNQEKELVCPNNLLGTNFDVYNTTRHGTDFAGAPVLVHAARPRVAVMNNSPGKGGTPGTFNIVKSSPGLLDFWQLHYSENVGREINSPDSFIANMDSAPTNHPAHFIKLSARTDGSFTVTNERTGFTREYAAPKAGASASR
ncbi:MAG TPA: MBL fold metallo-hydrolase [Terriglobia bacterium]|nr:MBL fold metallo-hydrolase [Terriglobia bacterium]